MKRQQSMHRKIQFRLIFMGLICIVLTSLLCILVFYKGFSDQIWRGLQSTARELAITCRHIPLPEGLAEFDNETIRITLLSSEGVVLYDSGGTENLGNHINRPEIQQAIQTGEGTASRRSDTTGFNTYYYAILLENGQILRMAQEDRYTWDVFGRALPIVIGCSLLLIVLSILVSSLLCKQLLRPIFRMTEDLEHIMEHVPYHELLPFAQAIHADHQMRENNEKLRQEFTANVSHELKTPLTSISGYAELISSGMAKPQDTREFAGRIHTEAQRMISLVNDILQLSKLDAYQRQTERIPAMETLDLMEIAQTCAERLKLNAQNAYVSISASGSSTLVRGDRTMLEELCQNLCDNAIRYNKPGGRVRIQCGKNSAGDPFLSVHDDGIGIPEEAQKRVFERFYRVDKSRSKATGGTGLGLAIVKHIAMLHLAEIQMNSRLEVGTSITVTFPKR